MTLIMMLNCLLGLCVDLVIAIVLRGGSLRIELVISGVPCGTDADPSTFHPELVLCGSVDVDGLVGFESGIGTVV